MVKSLPLKKGNKKYYLLQRAENKLGNVHLQALLNTSVIYITQVIKVWLQFFSATLISSIISISTMTSNLHSGVTNFHSPFISPTQIQFYWRLAICPAQ